MVTSGMGHQLAHLMMSYLYAQGPAQTRWRRERKETVAARYFAKVSGEGLALVGVARENANAFRPCSKRQRQAGKYSVTRATAFVKVAIG